MKKSHSRFQTSLAALAASLGLVASINAKTLTVTNIGDAGGDCPDAPCTLRQALAVAAKDDTISFSLPANSTIALTSGPLAITKNVTIIGPGARTLTISGSNMWRIFSNPAGVTTTISGLTIANAATGTASGGGIENFGTLTLLNCAVLNNFGGSGAGAVNGGGATLTVNNCTFAGNRSTGHGGALRNVGTLIVNNSTFNDNRGVNSGAITSFASSGSPISVTLTNCTISNNRATDQNGGIGGGIFNGNLSTTTLRNTLVAFNTAPGAGNDLYGPFTSQGYNLVRDTAGATFTTAPGASGDQIGTASALSPMLGAFQNNGGPTDTQGLLSGSPAIDRGDSGSSSADQRGFLRPVDSPTILNTGNGSDIGAYEVQADQLEGCNGGAFLVENNKDSGAGSLRDVIATACAGSTISFAANVRGAISLITGELVISKNLTINGPGANLLSVQRGAGNARVLSSPLSATKLSISGLTLANGNINNSSAGGVYNVGTLTLTNSAISGNMSSNNGAGMLNEGTVTITNSAFSGNTSSGAAGGIDNRGTLTITNTTISGNTAFGSNGSPFGGGILNEIGATLTIISSTISGNTASSGAGVINLGMFTARNTIIAKNTASAGKPDVNGAMTSQGFNLIGNNSGSNITQPPGTIGDQIGTPGGIIDPMLGDLQNNGGPTNTLALLSASTAINRGHSSGSSTDQRGFTRPIGSAALNGGDGSDIGAFEFSPPVPTPTPTPTPTATPLQGFVGNVSTRLPVGTGDNVLIEGFIVQGPAGSTKKIIVRAIGPSLIPFGVADALANPTLEIHDASNATVATNDDWSTTQVGGLIAGDQSAEINASQLAPSNDLESAIIANLVPGSYTAVVRGLGDTVGTGVVDAYDLSVASSAKLANVATRGLIQPGDKLMIAGFIVQNGPVRAVIRAVGPSLIAFGVADALADTTLQLKDQNGTIVLENDNWKTDQQQDLESTGLQPSHDLEAAVVATIQPGQYTAQVRGKNEASGIGVVQVYFLQ
jgi:hypothetical protein